MAENHSGCSLFLISSIFLVLGCVLGTALGLFEGKIEDRFDLKLMPPHGETLHKPSDYPREMRVSEAAEMKELETKVEIMEQQLKDISENLRKITTSLGL